MKAYTTSQTRTADREAIGGDEEKEREFMFRAANALFKNIPQDSRKILIAAGKGNNGGDGYALAEILLRKHIACRVLPLGVSDGGAAKYYYEKLKLDFPDCFTDNSDCSGYDCIVDCIFGTGFKGELSGAAQSAAENINRSGAYVIACDIPSGLDGDSGLVSGTCVCADLTVAVQTLKTGYFLNAGKDYTGRIALNDIGIKTREYAADIIGADILDTVKTPRKHFSNKAAYGKLSVIGGSPRFTGAATLAYMGAAGLRSGAGYAELCVPEELAGNYYNVVPECTVNLIGSKDGFMYCDKQSLSDVIRKSAAIVIGTGWGQREEYADIMQYISYNYDKTLIADADAIGYFHEVTKSRSAKVIITPHVKEFSRITGQSIPEIQQKSLDIAKKYALDKQCTVLLKGSTTIVTDGTKTALIINGSPALAKGGSGDVLSGVIGGLAARGIEPYSAACAGAYLCALSASNLLQKYNEHAILPSDVANNIINVL